MATQITLFVGHVFKMFKTKHCIKSTLLLHCVLIFHLGNVPLVLKVGGLSNRRVRGPDPKSSESQHGFCNQRPFYSSS